MSTPEPDVSGQDLHPFGAPPETLTAAQILAAPDLATKTIDVPEWGGSVTLTAPTYDEFHRLVDGKTDAKDVDQHEFGVRLLALMLGLGDDGAQILGRKNPLVITRLLKEAKPLLPVGPAEVAAAEATFPPPAAPAE